tara:strand:+ start:1318 stop:1596 length:279 start_codon:yes stop_codon:yes gene_type:complete
MTNFINVSVASTSNKVSRADAQMLDVFQVKGKDTLYANVGIRTSPPSSDHRYQSINIKTGEPASTSNGSSSITIVGKASLEVVLGQDYSHLV